MKKGMELPINMIIVIAIAVLVMVVIAAFFASQTGGAFNSIAVENTFRSACSVLISSFSCSSSQLSVPQFTAKLKASDPEAGKAYTLLELCQAKNIPTNDGGNACLRACGCTNI